MIILVFGIQGSGKSTHAHYIANKLGIPYVSTGDILREKERENSETGRKVKVLMERGKIIPDEITFPVLEQYLEKNNIGDSFVIEGFPRTMEQVRLFPREVDEVFEFVIPEKIALERLAKRGRYDDKAESIKTRIELFKEKTLPVIDFYKKNGKKVFVISNEPPIETVQKEIDESLKK